ncbi:MAG: SagB/ThcOx family dehydrogenase [Pseudonocardiaceae bacterium]
MLFVPSDVRLRLGRWGVGDAVLIERLTTRQRWTASPAVTAILVAFSGGRTRHQGAECAADALGVSQDELLRQIDILNEIGLLATTASDPDPLADQWRTHGWIAAYDHHLATWGFPLVDYTVDGWKVDQARIKGYRNKDPDPGPLAHDYCAELPTSLDLAESAQAGLTAPLTTVLHNTEVSGHLDGGKLCVLLAKTFCFTPTRAGKIRRTSPSGGARHPAEGYVITRGVSRISDGVWHVDAARSRLVRVPGAVDLDWTRVNLEGLHLAPFIPQAFVVVTSVFARNMYRYREPRTFRTVLMDVGHLLGTFEMVASALGLRSFVHHAINEIEVERMLSISPLKEGAIAGAAVAGCP